MGMGRFSEIRFWRFKVKCREFNEVMGNSDFAWRYLVLSVEGESPDSGACAADDGDGVVAVVVEVGSKVEELLDLVAAIC